MLPIKNADALFQPRSVVVAGASANPEKAGHKVLANLLRSGYRGHVVPVNPGGGEILGLQAVPADHIPEGMDLAVLCVPREAAPDVLADLAPRGIRAAVILASGFKEQGREGYYLEQQLASIARRHNIALLGPNSLGLLTPALGLAALTVPNLPPRGNIAFFSQSGSLCFGLLDWAAGNNVGFSSFAHLGNRSIFNEVHLLEYLRTDPETAVALGHVESLEHGQAFLRAAEDFTAEKPLIMLKGGVTPAGARAVSSHTGAMAGSREVYKAAFTQSGVIQVEDAHSMFLLAEAFSTQPLPKGPNVAVITNSGGPGILAADACDATRLHLATPGKATLDALREALPPYASLYNPIDIIGDAGADRYQKALQAVLADPSIHGVIVLLTPTASAQIQETAQAVLEVAKTSDKPVLTCFMGRNRVQPGRALLRQGRIPCYDFPEQAVMVMDALFAYWLRRNREFPAHVCYLRDKARAQRIMDRCRETGMTELVGVHAQELGMAYELPFPEQRLARTSDHAVKHARKVGYPVAMKIASPHITHKSDVGGSILNINSPAEVRQAFLTLTARTARRRPEAHILGCLVQAMAPEGSRDVRVKVVRDPQFGPLISFSKGGVYSEVLGDHSSRLAPLTLGNVQRIIRSIKAFPLLQGVRGRQGVDLLAIEDILLTASTMAMDFPQIEEADIGPILVYNKGALVVDMRVTLSLARLRGI